MTWYLDKVKVDTCPRFGAKLLSKATHMVVVLATQDASPTHVECMLAQELIATVLEWPYFSV